MLPSPVQFVQRLAVRTKVPFVTLARMTFAATAMQGALTELKDLTQQKIEDVILGCAFPEGEQGLNIARNAIFLTSLPATTSGETINRFCASGLQAIAHGAMSVQSGIAEAILAGGVESMSSVPMGGNKVSLHPKLVDEQPEVYIGMGHTAERVAKRFDVSREDQDKFAGVVTRQGIEGNRGRKV